MTEPSGSPEVVRLKSEHSCDVVVARSVALRFARRHGFSEVRAQEVAIVAGELASNLLRHASEGVLELEWCDGAVRLRSLDRGTSAVVPESLLEHRGEVPRMVEDSGALRAGLGCGLGAVRRLSDEVSVRRRDDGWLEITATRRG